MLTLCALLGILIIQSGFPMESFAAETYERRAAVPQSVSLAAPADVITLSRPYAIDGDTLQDRSTGERFRLTNIDTAESDDRAKCQAERAFAARATSEARRLLAEARIVQARPSGRTDRYGRTLARILVDGQDLGERLLAQGLARPWLGRRLAWCGSDGRLLIE